jgi:hypothetical protein
VPAEWQSGYYEATLSVEDDGGDWTHRGRRTAASVMGFVVRAAQPGGGSRVLLQLAFNSYLAYNNWGGQCFYGGFGRNGAQGTRAGLLTQGVPGGSHRTPWHFLEVPLDPPHERKVP